MKTFQRFLIVLGVFVFAYNASTIVHELGHGLTLIATGGELDFIEVSPFSWSYAHYRSNPEPMATSWSGFLWETIFGVLAFSILWIAKSRLSLFGVVLAIASLAGTGIYMLVGAVLRIGDSAALIRMGVPPAVLVITGSVLLLLVLPLILPLGGLLGVGKGKNKLRITILVFSPIVAYLLAMVAFNLWHNPDEWLMWVASVGGGLLLVVLVSVAVHFAWPWCGGAETQRRAIPINWRMCLLSLALGGGVVAAEYLAFPRPAPVPARAEPLLWWFQDEQNYAGGLFDPRDVDGGSAVFWNIDGQHGRRALPDFVWEGYWSSALKKLVVLTSTELLAISPSGETKSIFRGECLFPPWRINGDGSKAIVLSQQKERKTYYLVAIDLTTGANEAHETPSLPAGFAFIDANSAIAALPDARVAISMDSAGRWQFERQRQEDPKGKIIASLDGAVLTKMSYPEMPANTCRLAWNGLSTELPDIREAYSWAGRMFALAYDGTVYQIDDSMKADLILRPEPGRIPIGAGVSAQGLWIAYSGGEVVTHGDVERRCMLALPSTMP